MVESFIEVVTFNRAVLQCKIADFFPLRAGGQRHAVGIQKNEARRPRHQRLELDIPMHVNIVMRAQKGFGPLMRVGLRQTLRKCQPGQRNHTFRMKHVAVMGDSLEMD